MSSDSISRSLHHPFSGLERLDDGGNPKLIRLETAARACAGDKPSLVCSTSGTRAFSAMRTRTIARLRSHQMRDSCWPLALSRVANLERSFFSSRKAFSDCSSHSCCCVSDSFILSRNPGQIFPTEGKAKREGKYSAKFSASPLFAVETVWRKKKARKDSRESKLSFLCFTTTHSSAQNRAKAP
jgi:hypothetical protein